MTIEMSLFNYVSRTSYDFVITAYLISNDTDLYIFILRQIYGYKKKSWETSLYSYYYLSEMYRKFKITSEKYIIKER